MDTSKKDIKCDFCQKPFKFLSHLKRHAVVHSTEDSFECDICHQKFGRAETLELHAVVHVKDRPFQCEICKQTFKYKGNLKQHMELHTEARLLECSICQKTTRHKSNLRKHMKEVHGLRGEELETAMENSLSSSASTTPSLRSRSSRRARPDEDIEDVAEYIVNFEETEDEDNSAGLKQVKTEAMLHMMSAPPQKNILVQTLSPTRRLDEVKTEHLTDGIPMENEFEPLQQAVPLTANDPRLQLPTSQFMRAQPYIPNFDEDIRQISSHISRVANTQPDTQNALRKMLLESILAFESGGFNNDVSEFFRQMGARNLRL